MQLNFQSLLMGERFQTPLEDRFLDVQAKFTFVISGSYLYMLFYFGTYGFY